jgi:Zn-dependent protease with chaperone function
MAFRYARSAVPLAAALVLALALFAARCQAAGGEAATSRPPSARDEASRDELRPLAVPEPSAKALRYHQTGNWLWVGRQLWALAVPAALLFSGLSARLRTAAARIGRVWFFTIGIYAVLAITLIFLFDLPLDYYLGFVRQHEYGLSNQSLSRWTGNHLKALLVDLTAGFFFLWVPYLLLARTPKRWWLYTALLSLPFSIGTMLIMPIWIDPLFNHYGPMKDKGLEQKIAALAHRAGISGGRIYEVDKSRDSRALNAYVTGFFNTQRIVLYDTLIAALDEPEVLAVMGHEMGHYVLGHVARTVLLTPLVVLVGLVVVDRAGRWLIGRFSGRFGFDSLADVASAPLLLLLLGLTELVVLPLVLAYSRMQEHEADQFALEVTRTNHSAASAFVKLQETNLSVPWHTPLETLWRASHPSIGERIEFCNEYHPWTEGRPPVYGRYFGP